MSYPSVLNRLQCENGVLLFVMWGELHALREEGLKHSKSRKQVHVCSQLIPIGRVSNSTVRLA